MNNRPIKKESPFLNANRAVAVILFFSWIFFMLTLGITLMLFIPFVAANLLLAVFYNIRFKSRIFSNGVYLLRTVVCIILFVQLASPVIGLGFSETKAIYPVKRAVFGYGVKFGDDINTFLPKKLPGKCDNYYFRTQLIFLAQDYHPNAYLAFHCDDSYFPEYIESAEKHGKISEKSKTFDDYLSETINGSYTFDDLNDEQKAFMIGRYLNIPSYVIAMMNDGHRKMLTPEADVYYNFGSGSCIFDRTTGLMIFWS